MNSKNAILFLGIFSIFMVLAVALYFFSGGLSKKTSISTSTKTAQFPSTDTGRGNSFFNFFSGGFDSPANKIIIPRDASSSPGLTEDQYYYYSGTGKPVPKNSSKPRSSYPKTPTFENTTGNPETGYKPNPDDSTYKGDISISRVNQVYKESDDSLHEYVLIRANDRNTVKVGITGLKLRSMITGVEYSIDEGVPIYFRNIINKGEAIFLKPGDSAYVITGRSPLGVSFKSNKCVGYLKQYQTFYPQLQNDCPRIYYEGLPERPNALNDECLLYVERFPACLTLTSDTELEVTKKYGNDCASYIKKKANYDYCIAAHKSDPDFYDPTWYIYLGQSSHVWRLKREWIRLLDSNEKKISEINLER